MFWFQQIKLLSMLQLFDDCFILILLNVSLLTPKLIDCSLLLVREWLSTGMVVIQPYILVSKLKKQDRVPTLYWLPKRHIKPYNARCIANSSSCTTTELSKLLTSCLTAD